jgi:hypothetical protein
MSNVPVPAPAPPYVVGVSGLMRIERPEIIKNAIRDAFNILLDPGESQFRLVHTPIIVLTSLAPGADTLVAEVADELEKEYQAARSNASNPASIGPERRFRIVAPLPFPREQYLRASTFNGLNDEQKEAVSKKLNAMHAVGDAFFVPLREDLDLDDQSLRDRLDADLNDSRRRHLRYRAAGEYIAAHSNILLVINDDNPAEEFCPDDVVVPVLAELGADSFGFGSSEIMRLKRQGVTPGLLSTEVAFAWADAGPVFHIKTSDTNAGKAGVVRLFPVDTRPVGGNHVPNNDPTWQSEARRVFISIAKQHEQFNEVVQSKPDVAAKGQEKELEKLLGDTSYFPPSFRTGLDRLARVRRHASNLANGYSKGWDRLIVVLFLGALLTGLTLHVAVHWHPRPSEGNGARAVEEWAEDLQTNLTAVAVTIGGLCLVVWLLYRKSAHEACRYDYRALVEALRVQIYWAAAGLNRSVPANYLQRQRSEMVWVRRVITAMAAPYFRWRDWFQLMPLAHQVQVLQQVTDKWLTQPIEGQVDYAHRRARLHQSNEHFWQRFGADLALTGFIGAAVWAMMLARRDWFRGAFPDELHWLAVGAGVLFSILWLAGAVWAMVRAREKDLSKLTEPREDGCPWPRVWHDRPKRRHFPIEGFKWSWNIFRYVARFGNVLQCLDRDCEWLEFAVRLVAHTIIIALLTIAAGDICTRLGGVNDPRFPDVMGWWLICFGAFVILGGLAIAWAERNMMAEQARQYSAMESMYQAASRRLNGHLAKAHDAIRTGDEAVARGRIEAIQELIHQIGVQALDENAEWLMLHRARPIEPVPMG